MARQSTPPSRLPARVHHVRSESRAAPLSTPAKYRSRPQQPVTVGRPIQKRSYNGIENEAFAAGILQLPPRRAFANGILAADVNVHSKTQVSVVSQVSALRGASRPIIVHARRASLPKSRKAVFRPHSLDHNFIFPLRLGDCQDNSDTAFLNDYQGTRQPLVSGCRAPPEQLAKSAIPPDETIDSPQALTEVSNSASICIPPVALQSAVPSLLLPTPSFLSVQKSGSNARLSYSSTFSLNARASLSRAQPSLLLATPSFATLKKSTSNVMDFPQSSIPCAHKRGTNAAQVLNQEKRARSKLATSQFVAVGGSEVAIVPSCETVAVESPSNRNQSIYVALREPQKVGLPLDMLKTLDSLETLATTIKTMPSPCLPWSSRKYGVPVQGTDPEVTNCQNSSTVTAKQSDASGLHECGKNDEEVAKVLSPSPKHRPSAIRLPSKSQSRYSLLFRSVRAASSGQQASKIPVTPSKPAQAHPPNSASRLPRIRRMSLGRSFTAPTPSVKEKVPGFSRKPSRGPGRTFGSAKSMGKGLSEELAAATSIATPKASALRIMLRSRSSEPLPPVKTVAASKIARRARHSEVVHRVI